jgi:hypothetical protein
MATKKQKHELEDVESEVVVEAPAFVPEPNHHGGHHAGAYRGEVPIPAGSNAVPQVLVVADEE